MFGGPDTVEIPVSGLGKFEAFEVRNRLVNEFPGVLRASVSIDDNGWTGRVVLHVVKNSREWVYKRLMGEELVPSLN